MATTFRLAAEFGGLDIVLLSGRGRKACASIERAGRGVQEPQYQDPFLVQQVALIVTSLYRCPLLSEGFVPRFVHVVDQDLS